VAVPQMAIEISPLFAQGDQVLWIQLKRRRQVERMLMVDLEPCRSSAPPEARLIDQVSFAHPGPLRRAKMRRLPSEHVPKKLYMSLHRFFPSPNFELNRFAPKAKLGMPRTRFFASANFR